MSDVSTPVPENRETPLAETQSWVTPNRLFFVRSHYKTPELDASTWRLSIRGEVGREIELDCDQLDSLPQRSVFATLECAGNGRSFLQPRVEGVQWQAGAVGHAEWSGVPLKSVLDRVGLKERVCELVCTGADSGMEKNESTPTFFARGLPLNKALHPDTLLATRMNGERLSPSHGYPCRLLVPGWYGVASVKWLNTIEAVTEPFQGYFQTKKYTIQQQTGRGMQTESVGPMPVKSEIIRPQPDDELGIGTNRVFGMAWAGEHAVEAVEVSVDGGSTWRRAELNGPSAAYSWTLWEYLWEIPVGGEYTLMSRAISASGELQPAHHDPLRGGYLITFSRAVPVTVDRAKQSRDMLGDVRSLHEQMNAVAEARAQKPLDVEMAFAHGAGI